MSAPHSAKLSIVLATSSAELNQLSPESDFPGKENTA
jgi:hypothetical protein